MPPWASANAPLRSVIAPVNEPLTWPNSALSISSRGTEPQSNTTNGPSLRVRVVVDLLGDQLLAGAGLALDQHGGVGGGDVLQQLEQLAHLGVAADELAEGALLERLGLDDLLFGQELDDRAAELELGAEADRDLLEPRALDEGAVGRALVAEDHLLAFPDGQEVTPGHGLVRERHLTVGEEPK